MDSYKATRAAEPNCLTHLEQDTAFRPVEVGVSPGGVVWVAYRPEHVAPMKLRLAALRTREATRAR